jgi:hypothetical protein
MDQGLASSLTPSANGTIVLAEDAITFRWVLRNDSDEMLGLTRLILVDGPGQESEVLLEVDHVLPKSVRDLTVVHHEARSPAPPLRLKVQFADAVGRWWEREPGQPLKRLPRRPAEAGFSLSVGGTWIPVARDQPEVREFRADSRADDDQKQ